MKVTKCENRFEVVLDGMVDEDEVVKLHKEFVLWLSGREAPTEEDYLAAMGPCGK